jgi:plastocyanin domain-containing protein
MKPLYLSILIAGVLIVGSVVLTSGPSSSSQDNREKGTANNVSEVAGVQYIDIDVRGGYSPRVTEAKAGLATVLRMKTSGSLDCSIALVIPAVSYRKNLPMTGVTEIDIPPQESGEKMRGLCSMGMYSFTINFN